MSELKPPQNCPMCGAGESAVLFHYDAPPAGETVFDFPSGDGYQRDIWRCGVCGHCISRHDMDLRELYEGQYVDATYGAEGLLRSFERIMALAPERSDNHHRVQRVIEYMSRWMGGGEASGQVTPCVLDVGSGLCVFPAKLKEQGWSCTALDPDPRAVEHARRQVGVKAVCGDFVTAQGLGTYDLITLNKVLEHVPDPVVMLRRCHRHLRPGGVVYVEVPDAEGAARDGPEREEFFIEHLCIFSMSSLCLLSRRAGFLARLVERVREPSSKYTLRAFLAADPNEEGAPQV